MVDVSGAPISVDTGNIRYNATEDVLFQEVIEPVDISGEIIDWEFQGPPSWLTFLNGTMFGIPGNDHVGWNNFTITIMTTEESSTLNVSIDVLNSVPVIVEGSVAPMAWEGREYRSTFDLREDGSKWTATISMDGPWNDTWAVLEIGGDVFGTPKNIHVGNWTLNITLDDGNGGVVWYQWPVTVVNENPRIWVEDIGVVQEWEEKIIDFQCSSENDGATYYELVRTNLNSGIFDRVNGQFTFIPREDGTTYGYLTVRALDFHGGMDEMRIEFPINNTLPYLLNELPTEITAGEITYVDIDSSEEGKGLRYSFQGSYPPFTDRFFFPTQFEMEGRLTVHPWNMDAGEHSIQFFIWDEMDARVFYYWNFTVIPNGSFSDPTLEIEVLEITTKSVDVSIEVQGSKWISPEQIEYNWVEVEIPGSHESLFHTKFNPLTQSEVTLEYQNLSGTMNLTVYVQWEHIEGCYRTYTKTMQIQIPDKDPDPVNDSSEDGSFPWWIIMIVMVLLIIIIGASLIFVENISYAFQMAIFRGGNIDEEPIISLVHDRPGINFKELMSYSNFSRKDLVSTLVQLEKSGTIRPIPDGTLVRFYPTVGSFVEGPLVLNKYQQRIARVLMETKKMAHQDLSNETGITKRKLKREASLMELKGALSRRTGHEDTEYYLSIKQKKQMSRYLDERR